MKNKLLLILLTVMCISPMFADTEVMVPSVSPEHFKLLDQIVQIQFGLLSKSNESQIEQELKKLAERDTLAVEQKIFLCFNKMANQRYFRSLTTQRPFSANSQPF